MLEYGISLMSAGARSMTDFERAMLRERRERNFDCVAAQCEEVGLKKPLPTCDEAEELQTVEKVFVLQKQMKDRKVFNDEFFPEIPSFPILMHSSRIIVIP
jgi:hypothetical protein